MNLVKVLLIAALFTSGCYAASPGDEAGSEPADFGSIPEAATKLDLQEAWEACDGRVVAVYYNCEQPSQTFGGDNCGQPVIGCIAKPCQHETLLPSGGLWCDDERIAGWQK